MNSFPNACRAGNFYYVMATLKANQSSVSSLLQMTDANGWNCLQWTAWHSNVECMEFLLKLKECDVTVKDSTGRTALHIALLPRTQQVFRSERGHPRFGYPRDPSYEIVKMLLEVVVKNNDMSCFNEQNPNVLAVALMNHHIDVVKLLIDCSAFHKFSEDIFWHTAAAFQRVDCMRYLLCRPEYNPKKRNVVGWQPCFILIQNILSGIDEEPVYEEIDFCAELLLRTVDAPADTLEVYFMLADCFRYKDNSHDGRARKVFTEIVKILMPHHPRAHLIDDILRTKLQSSFSLVTFVLLKNFKENPENCQLIKSTRERYLGYLEDMKHYFLRELFDLYTVNEKLFEEYIAEVVEMRWSLNKWDINSLFFVAWSFPKAKQKLFSFVKTLIFHKFDFVTLRPLSPPLASITYRTQSMHDFLLNIFVPLSKFVNAPIELMKILRWIDSDRHFNFNEFENCMNDFARLSLERNSNHTEVVSLKNLSRMSVRKHLFGKLTHYEALSAMYSFELPVEIRKFLCYNPSNFKFFEEDFDSEVQ